MRASDAAEMRAVGGILAGGVAVGIVLALGGGQAGAALAGSYPPFVLVGGLLLIGMVAGREGLFEMAAARLVELPIGPVGLLGCCYLLVWIVTAILNLDTSVVFLTPVLIGVARQREVDRRAFVYGSVFMANASSLVLEGSNLTNLLVLSSTHRGDLEGAGFFTHMAVVAVTAPIITGVLLIIIHRRRLHEQLAPLKTSERRLGGQDVDRASGPPTERPRGRLGDRVWRGPGLWGMVGGAILMVTVAEPALPVAVVGVVVALLDLSKGRTTARQILTRIGIPTLVLLFVVSVILGTAARLSSFPGDQMSSLGAVATAGVAALASILINNLPAASLLGARASPHVGALLLGLNLGPNLAVSGSLSVLLWWRACRSCGVRPSAVDYSRQGIILAPIAILGSLAIAAVL